MKKLIVLLAMILFSACGSPDPGIYGNLPESSGKWKKTGDDQMFDRETLYNYINGGAELYLTFSFNEVFVRRFIHEDDPDFEIVLDVYDMGSPAEAFGIFSSEREDDDIGIGVDSEFGGGLLRFWKGKYFVSMVVLGDPDQAKEAMMDIARQVAAVIPERGSHPELLNVLPENGRIWKETRYFHAVQSLNNQYYIASENILDLGPDTDCAWSMYERDGESGFLMVIKYPSEDASKKAFASFIEVYMPEGADSNTVQMENGRWTSAKNSDEFIAIVFEVSNSEWAEKLLSEINFR